MVIFRFGGDGQRVERESEAIFLVFLLVRALIRPGGFTPPT